MSLISERQAETQDGVAALATRGIANLLDNVSEIGLNRAPTYKQVLRSTIVKMKADPSWANAQLRRAMRKRARNILAETNTEGKLLYGTNGVQLWPSRPMSEESMTKAMLDLDWHYFWDTPGRRV